jgi:DUF3048 family protein
MKKLKKFFRRLSRKQKIILTIVVLLIVAAIAVYAFGLFDKEKEPAPPPEPIYSQLMGIEVKKDVAERPILGVMIENSTFARPQTGLSSAGMVFETVAEGGITRYLVLFQEKMPKEVGPVRSVRSYYVDWLMGLDASVAHVGGSADALALIDSRNAKTLSQFKYPDPYRRVSDRAAPHNMYASTASLQELQKKLGHKTATFDEIPRSNDSPTQTPDATKISISFSGPDFATEWRYDKTTNTYKRFLAGAPDNDAATKKQITAKNVVVIQMPTPAINATGKGKAKLFKDGTVQTINWKQSSFRDRIVLTDSQGNEVLLNRGNTWFAVIPSTGSTTYR